MRIFGLEISRAKALAPAGNWRNGWRVISEPFAGAWQRNKEIKVGDLSCYPTLYACLNRISQDIGKLPFVLKLQDTNGIWNPVTANSPFWPVLKKPNGYQTAQQFRESWILSKLMHGNTYVLKARDARGVVNALYVLDPCRVEPLISESGAVYYRLYYSTPNNLLPEAYDGAQVTIPASEIIHDRLNTFHNHLIGVPPLCAAYWPTAKNMEILKNSAEFFGNAAQPGGILSGPAGMTDEDAKAVSSLFNDPKYRGKIIAVGADLKFQGFASKSADSQLVEQMQHSDVQICQPFGIPPYKIGIGSIPAGMGVDSINQLYYDDALQAHIQAMECLLTQGLATAPMKVDVDESVLLRMDAGKKAEFASTLVGGKIMLPNEARKQFGLTPTDGGDTLWGQNQDYPLGMLANRAEWDPEMQPQPAPAQPEPDPDAEESKRQARQWAPIAIMHRARQTLKKRKIANAAA